VVLPPHADHLHEACVAVDPGLDSSDETVAEKERQHVPPPAPFLRREEELPHVVESEQGAEEWAVPDQGVERGGECDGGRGLGRPFQQVDVLFDDPPLPPHALDVDGHELSVRDETVAQCRSPGMPGPPRIGLRGPESAEDVWARDPEEAMGAVAREKLGAHLLRPWDLPCEHLGRKQPLAQVVVAAVAGAASRSAPTPRRRSPPRPPPPSPAPTHTDP